MVLGIISEKMRMDSVISADASPNQRLPNTSVTCAPTPAEPMVLAMVLSDRMAAMGRVLSVLYRLKRAAGAYPSSSRMVIYEMGVDISTDSRMEQRKEMRMAPSRNMSNSVISRL